MKKKPHKNVPCIRETKKEKIRLDSSSRKLDNSARNWTVARGLQRVIGPP